MSVVFVVLVELEFDFYGVIRMHISCNKAVGCSYESGCVKNGINQENTLSGP